MKQCIVTLIKSYFYDIQYKDVIIRNRFIEENLNDKENTDIIIFHESDVSESNKAYIQSQTKLPLIFIKIPDFDPISGITFDPETEDYGGWGYRHMCNFWFIEFHKYLKDYDLAIRIDDDCIINFNVDKMFENLKDKVFVFAEYASDWHFVTKNLNSLTRSFLQTSVHKDPGGPYTNLTGFNLKKLRENKKIFSYMEKVRRSSGIYIFRWGDLPLWGEVIHYFYTEKDYLVDTGIKYYHGSHACFVNWK